MNLRTHIQLPHRSGTDCTLMMRNIGIESPGEAAYMLVWADEQATDADFDRITDIIRMVNDYFDHTPAGRIYVIGGEEQTFVVMGGQTYAYPNSSCKVTLATVYKDRVLVPCQCFELRMRYYPTPLGPSAMTTVWQA